MDNDFVVYRIYFTRAGKKQQVDYNKRNKHNIKINYKARKLIKKIFNPKHDPFYAILAVYDQ